MNQLNKEDFYKLGIVSIVFLIIVGIVILNNFTSKDDENKVNNFEIVSDYNIFFFINNNINHFLSYTINRNAEATMNFLDLDFKENQNITLSSVFSVLPTYHEGDLYRADLTKVYPLNDNVEVYYTEGQIINEGYDETTIVSDFVSYLLYVDFHHMTASIDLLDSAFDEEKFKNESDKSKEILVNSYNKIEQISIIDYTRICSMYLSDFILKAYNSIHEGYSLVTNFDSLEDFRSYLDNHNLTSDIFSCNQNINEDGKRVYQIFDKNNNKYNFIEDRIFNYKVSLSN